MKGLKWVGTIVIFIGIISIFYGWVQSFDIGVEFPIDEYKRVVRSYVFTISGLIVIIIGILFEILLKYIQKVESRMIGMSRNLKNK